MLQSEVVPHLIQQIYLSKPDLKLPKTALHKILFRVKRDLSEYNPVGEALPFYWYNYGPYSEVVESSIDALKSRGILREEETHTGKSLLMLNDHLSDTVNFEEVNTIIERIINKVNPYNLEAFVNQIYQDYAPYEFMLHYKVDFLSLLEEYLKSHPASQSTLNKYIDEPDTPAIDRLEDTLYECEAELVEEQLFDSFNDEFTDFVSGAGKAFDLIRDGEDYTPSIPDLISTVAVEIWRTFAKGIRTLENGHDRYYEPKLEKWIQDYQTSFTSLSYTIDRFNMNVSGNTLHNTPRETDERSKRIISSLVEGYLS